jgi:alanyl-tRNA synthetase
MKRECATCYWHLGAGTCARGCEVICQHTNNGSWTPILVHATAVDAARYVEAINYQGPGVTIKRRDDGRYVLGLEGLT